MVPDKALTKTLVVWECKLVQSLWKTVWRFLNKLQLKLPFVVVVQSLSHVSLWPHGLQHNRLTCPSLSTGACSNSCPLSQWCHPTIPSSVPCFSSCLQPFPASGSFPVSRLSTSGGQSIRASASALVLLVNIQDLFPLWLTGLISLQAKGLSRIFSSTTVWRHQFFGTQHFQLSSSHIGAWLLEKP